MSAFPRPRLVTIDGPAGSGKTTLGRRLSALLGVPLVDTGAVYRALTVAAAERGIAPHDAAALTALSHDVSIEMNTDPLTDPSWVRLDGQDVTWRLRDPTLAPLLAAVSRTPGVRDALLGVQRGFASGGEAVAVGRDCGTVVFPGAPVKFYLDAPAGIREQRRATQLAAHYGAVGRSVLAGEVEDRDRSDAGRSAAPMRPAPDAVIIRTDELGIEAMVDCALHACRSRGLLA